MGETHTLLRDFHSIGEATRERLVSPLRLPMLTVFGFDLLGWSEAREGYTFVRTKPEYGQVKLTVAGQGKVWADGGWKTATAGTVYLSPPGTLSAFQVEAGRTWTIGWVHYLPREFSCTHVQSTLVAAETSALYWSVKGVCAEASGPADEEMLVHWLTLTAASVRRLLGPSTGDPRLQLLWQRVEADLAHPWRLDELAAQIAVSTEHLRRLCHSATQRSPMAEVTRLRMRHAATLLSSGRYPVAEVAARVGYDNPFAFSTAFKRVIGHPPSASRR
jgi:AraC-like DNA-binding protein